MRIRIPVNEILVLFGFKNTIKTLTHNAKLWGGVVLAVSHQRQVT
jgi:hypothetical protein